MSKNEIIQIEVNGVKLTVHFEDLGEEHPHKKGRNPSTHKRWRAQVSINGRNAYENCARGVDKLSAAKALAEKVEGKVVV